MTLGGPGCRSHLGTAFSQTVMVVLRRIYSASSGAIVTLQILCELSTGFQYGSVVRLAAVCCDDLQSSVASFTRTGFYLQRSQVHWEAFPGVWCSMGFDKVYEGVAVMG